MACEAFTLANHSFMLPGLGSYLALASGNGNTRAMLWGLGVLIAVIVVLDQLMWRPLIAWSQRFKMELSDDPNAARSWMLDLLRRSRIIGAAQHRVGIPVAEALDRAGAHRAAAMPPGGRPLARAARSGRLLFAAAILAMAGWGAFLMLRLLAGVAPVEWLRLTVDAGATLLRVAVALLLAIGWTVPVGMAIGLRPRLARVAQPIAQVAASVPATALFPIVLLLLLRAGGGLNLASVLLMLLGTQWYVLFNVIAGATAIPRDLIEAASLTKIRGWMLWRTLLLPAIFPFLVTGMLTAQGGAFNASIVSEYVVFGGRILRTTGLGATIAAAANSGNYSLLAASTVALATVVVLLNSLIWRRAAHLAEERYHV
jgi:NitT/TauT family transport system permease protein